VHQGCYLTSVDVFAAVAAGITPEGVQRRVVEVLEGLSAPPPPPVNRAGSSPGTARPFGPCALHIIARCCAAPHSLQSGMCHRANSSGTGAPTCHQLIILHHSSASQVLANRLAATKSAAPARQLLAYSQRHPSAHHLRPCSQQQVQQRRQRRRRQLVAAKTGHTLSAGQATAALAAAAAAAALPGALFSTAAAATRLQGCRCKAQRQLGPQVHQAAPPSATAAAAGAGQQ
jgi:hypothetical protein